MKTLTVTLEQGNKMNVIEFTDIFEKEPRAYQILDRVLTAEKNGLCYKVDDNLLTEAFRIRDYAIKKAKILAGISEDEVVFWKVATHNIK